MQVFWESPTGKTIDIVVNDELNSTIPAMKTINFVNPSHIKAKKLLEELNETLLKITGDDGTTSYDDKSFNPNTDIFILIEVNSRPVGCGAFRNIDDSTCEIKRMFSNEKGIGRELLKILEEKAISYGYQYAKLSTRLKNQNAVTFYRRNGYKLINAYGKYVDNDKSICLGKKLFNQSLQLTARGGFF